MPLQISPQVLSVVVEARDSDREELILCALGENDDIVLVVASREFPGHDDWRRRTPDVARARRGFCLGIRRGTLVWIMRESILNIPEQDFLVEREIVEEALQLIPLARADDFRVMPPYEDRDG